MKRLLSMIAFCLTVQLLQSQPLSLESFLAIVKKYHPVARQAEVGVAIAKADVTVARGGFDPLLTNEIARKEVGGLLYYDEQVTELKVPTWYGIDVVAGVQSISGARTATTDTKGASSYFGFSVPLGKGLLMDKRRAALQTARLFQNLSLQEQRGLLNDLLYEAAGAYWMWWQQHETQRLFEQAVANAEQRLRLVKTACQLGDRPAIDTLEALAQLQTIQQRKTDIAWQLANSQLDVSNFLWLANGNTPSLPSTAVPQQLPVSLESLQIENLVQTLQSHPELQQYQIKLAALQVEKRLKQQSLLPSVYLKYHQLNPSHDLTKSFTSPWLQSNYRYGIAVAVPLRLSEGRGDYRRAKLKIEQTQWAQLHKKVLLQTKLQQYYNEWKNIRSQVAWQQSAINAYTALQRGEELKFLNGESSLFLVNAREIKTLEARQKLIELQSKEGKAVAGTFWAAGTLINERR